MLRLIRDLPAHEYEQAARAPGWFTVVVGGGMAGLALAALLVMAHAGGGDQVFIGLPRAGSLLLFDAYTLWGSLLLGTALAVGAWVPAARRSVPAGAVFPYPLLLLFAWLCLLMLAGARLGVTLTAWLLLLAGVGGLWFMLYRPRRRWQEWEMPLVLLLAAVLGAIGLGWLHALAHGDPVNTMWSVLLSAPPRATNTAALLVIVGWLGPAIYLPWWLWNRREEAAMIWLPGALLLALAGYFTLVHVLCLAFPTGSEAFMVGTGLEQLFLIKRLLGWMLAWGLLALIVGSGWLAYTVILRRPMQVSLLRPFVLVAAGMLLLTLTVALQAPRHQGIAGLLWWQFTWTGLLCTWLAAGGLLTALAPEEQGERATVAAACWLAVAALVAVPPGPGYRALAILWAPMQQLGVPRALVVFVLVLTGLCTALLLPRWINRQAAPSPRPGAAWGIIGPFALAFILITCGILSRSLDPLFAIIRASLLQAN